MTWDKRRELLFTKHLLHARHLISYLTQYSQEYSSDIMPTFKKNYFWLLLVFIAGHGLSLVAESGGYSLVAVLQLLVAVAPLVMEHRL